MKLRNFKKVLGGIAVLVFLFLCSYTVIKLAKDVQDIEIILKGIIWLIGILFGIKAATGYAVKREELKNVNTENKDLDKKE